VVVPIPRLCHGPFGKVGSVAGTHLLAATRARPHFSRAGSAALARVTFFRSIINQLELDNQLARQPAEGTVLLVNLSSAAQRKTCLPSSAVIL
jgi:hypothetical protein